MQKDDVDTILSWWMHPRVFQLIAETVEQGSLTADQVKQSIKEKLQDAWTKIKTESWSIDMANKKPCEIDSGDPCFILTLTYVIKTDEKTVKIEAQTFAVYSDNKWHLINPGDKQTIELLPKIYPGLEKIKITATKISVN